MEIYGKFSMPRHIGRAVVYKDHVKNKQIVKASGTTWCSHGWLQLLLQTADHSLTTVACFSKPAKGLSMYSRKKPCLGWEGLVT